MKYYIQVYGTGIHRWFYTSYINEEMVFEESPRSITYFNTFDEALRMLSKNLMHFWYHYIVEVNGKKERKVYMMSTKSINEESTIGMLIAYQDLTNHIDMIVPRYGMYPYIQMPPDKIYEILKKYNMIEKE